MSNKPVQMISLRTVTIRSTTGHTVHIEARVPTEVPGPIVAEAMALGVVPYDANEIPESMLADKTKHGVVDFHGNIRSSLLFLTIRAMVEKNDANDFSGSGMPKHETLAKMLGYPVTKKEATDAYREFQDLKSNDALDSFKIHEHAVPALEIMEAGTKARLIEIAKDTDYPDADGLKGLTMPKIRSALLVHLSGTSLE